MSFSRRAFLKSSTLAAARGVAAPAEEREPAAQIPPGITRHWPCPQLWANRFQDWRIHDGRLECLTDARGDELRTAMLLTREIGAGPRSAHLRVRTGRVSGSGGWAGFLIGGGAGELDWRAAALILKPSGTNGGFLCCYESSGELTFREHTNEQEPTAYARIPAEAASATAAREDDVELRLDIEPAGGAFNIRFSAWKEGKETGAVTRRGVAEKELLGSVGLISSLGRNWFRDFRVFGEKVRTHPERSTGPILGTLYSLNGRTLKLSVQLMPVGERDPQDVRFEYRQRGGRWKPGATAAIQPGSTALFRLTDWDPTKDWQYRVLYGTDSYEGLVRRDPAGKQRITVALYSCNMAMVRSGPQERTPQEFPHGQYLGRYTHKCIYFPHSEVIANSRKHRPDILLFTGDQIYETTPGPKVPDDEPTLDYLYKWSLWVWAFRDLTRDTPTIVQVDDHDVYHGNIWGDGGRKAEEQDSGGYLRGPAFVNIVQRTMCSHNPDPYDATPVEQGISVYYCAFKYGGVGFAVLEDRKFKPPPPNTRRPNPGATLLGERQEKFLAEWGKDWAGVKAKICVTQTVWGCAQTTPEGKPARDTDSNGYPKPGRERAVRLLREARALLLSGDQHLGTLIRHGIETHTDGIVQFSAPATGTHFQRWFEPATPLANPNGAEHTGDFTDAFGNRFRMLAVANPPLSFRDYRKTKRQGQGLQDRTQKADGYGIIHVDSKAGEFLIECWPWNTDPAKPGAKQYRGWPYRLKFRDA